MTWRLRVRHRTGFRYAGDVVASYNEARMTPLTCEGQTTLDTRLDVSPPASVMFYVDHWGTHVTAFDVLTPHQELTVTATSIVETGAPTDRIEAPAGWDALEDPDLRDQLFDYVTATGATEPDEELAALAREWSGDLAPREAARAMATRLREEMEYVQDVTHVHTRAVDAWRLRAGVCQDITHVLLTLLRSRGIPARYVSGYLHPVDDAVLGHAVAGESHAWVEWWDGTWTGHDPTNDVPMGERHVVVARGREYNDVPPLKGIYSGPESTALGVEVEITRLG
jgi:transglutaminase-like putative cysteine protease